MTDTEKIKLIRQAMPAVENRIYLNTGTAGPLTTMTIEAMTEANAQELTEGRANLSGFALLQQAIDSTRRSIANLVQANPQEIAITHHTTEGMNIITHGLTWQPGDEIVTTTSEHEGGLLPLYILRQRYPIILKMVDILPEDSPDEIVARFEAAITPRTRLLVFSHVTWNTGLQLPLAKIVAMGHRHHVLSLVDGAQSAGAIPLDLPASSVDFYALPGQKWLCGPEGIGALYLRQDQISLVSPTFGGFLTLENPTTYDFTGYFLPAQGARRYEVGTIYRPGIQAMAAHLTWLEETIGWEWIYARIAYLAQYARDALSRVPGLKIITPPGPQAGLISFNLEGYDPARVMTRLTQDKIVLRFIRHPYCLRISTGFYNTEADIDHLITGLQTILKANPESLPPFAPPW